MYTEYGNFNNPVTNDVSSWTFDDIMNAINPGGTGIFGLKGGEITVDNTNGQL